MHCFEPINHVYYEVDTTGGFVIKVITYKGQFEVDVVHPHGSLHCCMP